MESVKSVPRPSGPGPRKVSLRVQWEKLPAIIREARYLTARQQAEVGEDYQPYSPNWDFYLESDRVGSCSIWTARTIEGGVLVGYIVWLLYRGLHCVDTIFASADLVYLTPEYREGMTGYKLLKSGISAIRPRAQMIRVETNDLYEGGRMGVLLERLGLRRIGSVYQGPGQ